MRSRIVIAAAAAVLVSGSSPIEAQQRIEREFLFGPFRERVQREQFDEREERDGAGMMLCSAFIANDWRDTIPVPDTWRPRDCFDFAREIGASEYSLGCVFERGRMRVSFGEPGSVHVRDDGSLPEPNCGWSFRRQR
jgi:hypothetical protein